MTYDIPNGTNENVATAVQLIHDSLTTNGPFTESDVEVWVNQNGQVHVDFDIEFEEFPVRQDISSALEAQTHLDNAYAALIGTADEELIESFQEWRREHEDDLDI